jgi:alpha-glucosidase
MLSPFVPVTATQTLASPDGATVMTVWSGDQPHGGRPPGLWYQVTWHGRQVVLPSRLGLWLGGAPPLFVQLDIAQVEVRDIDETWTPIAGERQRVRDHCREFRLSLAEKIPPRRSMTLRCRLYDGAVAWRYELEADAAGLTVVDELTQWRLPEGCQGYATQRAQGLYTLLPIDDVGSGCERPLTVVYPDGAYAAIGEAGNLASPRMKLRSAKTRLSSSHSCITHPFVPGTLESELSGPARGDAGKPWQSPWRFVMFSHTPGGLLEQNDLLLNLSPPCALSETSWIRPGKVIREMTLSMEGARACIDFARRRGLQYIEFDAGWYGFEFHDHSSALGVNVDPNRRAVHPGLTDVDIATVVQEAAKHGIGVWCYVNRRALERQLDEALDRLAGWGVVGIKFGFVEVGDQAWTRWLHDAVAKAAQRRLMVDIHDEYRVTGITRTLPNLLTVEGIRGNEEFPTPTHNLTLPFTRFLCGPADYTICIASPRLQTRRLHQVAMSVVYFSPLQFVYWYDQPKEVIDSPELVFLDRVPTTWHETRVIAGSIGEFVVVARRREQTWFVGAMTNEQPRRLELPLAFLGEGEFRACVFADPGGDVQAVAQQVAVRAGQTLAMDMPAASGWCAIIDRCPASE